MEAPEKRSCLSLDGAYIYDQLLGRYCYSVWFGGFGPSWPPLALSHWPVVANAKGHYHSHFLGFSLHLDKSFKMWATSLAWMEVGERESLSSCLLPQSIFHNLRLLPMDVTVLGLALPIPGSTVGSGQPLEDWPLLFPGVEKGFWCQETSGALGLAAVCNLGQDSSPIWNLSFLAHKAPTMMLTGFLRGFNVRTQENTP